VAAAFVVAAFAAKILAVQTVVRVRVRVVVLLPAVVVVATSLL
jgi:hypothetical protein